MKNKTLLLFIAILTSFAGFSQGPVSTMTTVTTTSSSSFVPIVDNATGANRKISIGNLVTVGAGNYLIKGTNTYTANTVIAPVGTMSISSSGLTTIGSTSVAVTGTSVLFSGAGTPGASKVLTSDASGYATWQAISTNTAVAAGSTTQLQYNNAGALGGAAITYSVSGDYRMLTPAETKTLLLRSSDDNQRVSVDDSYTEIIAGYNGTGSSISLAEGGSITSSSPAHYWYTSGGNDYNFASDVPGGGTKFGILNFGSIATSNKTFTFPNATGTITLTDASQTLSNKTIATPTVTTSATIPQVIDPNKVIDVTTGDAATINAMAGRFRKDNSGALFTLTNSYVTANSIVIITIATNLGATVMGVEAVAGAGFFYVYFNAAPAADTDINFLVIN